MFLIVEDICFFCIALDWRKVGKFIDAVRENQSISAKLQCKIK